METTGLLAGPHSMLLLQAIEVLVPCGPSEPEHELSWQVSEEKVWDQHIEVQLVVADSDEGRLEGFLQALPDRNEEVSR